MMRRTLQSTITSDFRAGFVFAGRGLACVCVCGSIAQGVPRYGIERIGLAGGEHQSPTGVEFATVVAVQGSAGGVAAAGTSSRYLANGLDGGASAWYWNGAATMQLGYTGPEYTNVYGVKRSGFESLTPWGGVLGYSETFNGSGVSTVGNAIWLYEPVTSATTRLGFFGSENRSSNGNVLTTVPLASTEQLAGMSARYTGSLDPDGLDCWVYRDGQQVQIGLVGGVYTGTDGYQWSEVLNQDESGMVSGWSKRYLGVDADLGRDAWVWSPRVGTVRIGLSGAGYEGSNGNRYSIVRAHEAVGMVAGVSARLTSVNANHGQDAWVWRSGVIEQVGLLGPEYVGSEGRRYSDIEKMNASGAVAGISNRIIARITHNGADVWVWNGQSTQLIGLTGAEFTGSAGYRSGNVIAVTSSGHVIGRASRYRLVSTMNGWNPWMWIPHTSSTVRMGLAGDEYTGSDGYQLAEVTSWASTGFATGRSALITGTQTLNGYRPWTCDPITGETHRTGLQGPQYVGSGGYELHTGGVVNESGFVIGPTALIIGVNSTNGSHAWSYNPVTHTTTRIGLYEAIHTGSSGFQQSRVERQNGQGVATGFSNRVAGVSTLIGYDAWYFDPATGVTTPLVGSVRTSDGYALSRVFTLTEDGVAIGSFNWYANGGAGEDHERAFMYSPSMGLVELGMLVDGGLSAAGWMCVSRVIGMNGLQTLVGHGRLAGQTVASQSAFVMRELPPCPSDFNDDGVVDLFDYLDFVAAFAANDSIADFNADTVIDFFDYLDFVAAFSSGC